MFPIKESRDYFKNTSDKVYNLNDKLNKEKCLKLPNNKYGPLCNKILKDFIDFHNLNKDLPLPVPGIAPHEALSRIFDIILYSLGPKKREEILKEIELYNKSLDEY